MKLVINGEIHQFSQDTLTILELFSLLGLSPVGKMIEINQVAYSESAFGTVTLCDKDRIEIVQFLGGGA